MILPLLTDILTVGTAVKVGAGAAIHKAYQWVVAKIKTAEADAKKVVADVKKDL
jgi:hypothetical protein